MHPRPPWRKIFLTDAVQLQLHGPGEPVGNQGIDSAKGADCPAKMSTATHERVRAGAGPREIEASVHIYRWGSGDTLRTISGEVPIAVRFAGLQGA